MKILFESKWRVRLEFNSEEINCDSYFVKRQHCYCMAVVWQFKGFSGEYKYQTKEQKKLHIEEMAENVIYVPVNSSNKMNKNVFNFINWFLLILGILSAAVLVAAACKAGP